MGPEGGRRPPDGGAALAAAPGGVAALQVMAQALGDLGFEARTQVRDPGGDVRGKVLFVEVAAAEVARVQQRQQILEDPRDLILGRQAARREGDGARLDPVARDQLVGQPVGSGSNAHRQPQATACIFSTSTNRPSNSAPDR